MNDTVAMWLVGFWLVIQLLRAIGTSEDDNLLTWLCEPKKKRKDDTSSEP